MILRADHEKVLGSLVGVNRDRLLVLAGTGWHVTELMRFAAGGVVAPLPSTASREHGASAVLVYPRRKSGEMQRTPVSQELLKPPSAFARTGRFPSPSSKPRSRAHASPRA